MIAYPGNRRCCWYRMILVVQVGGFYNVAKAILKGRNTLECPDTLVCLVAKFESDYYRGLMYIPGLYIIV